MLQLAPGSRSGSAVLDPGCRAPQSHNRLHPLSTIGSSDNIAPHTAFIRAAKRSDTYQAASAYQDKSSHALVFSSYLSRFQISKGCSGGCSVASYLPVITPAESKLPRSYHSNIGLSSFCLS